MDEIAKKTMKELHELSEIDIYALYSKFKNLETRVGTMEDANKNFVIAKYQLLHFEFLSAVEYMEWAESVYIANDDRAALVLLYTSLLGCFRKLGDGEKSRMYAERAITLAEELNDDYCMINAYIYGAVNAMYMDDPETGLKYIERTEALLEASGSLLHRAHHFHNLAYSYTFRKDYDRVIEYCERAYCAYVEFYGTDRARNVLIALINKSSGYADKGEHRRAIEILKRALEIAEQENYVQITLIALKALAEAYHTSKEYESALSMIKRYDHTYMTWMLEKLAYPKDENEELQRKLEFAQDLEMVKSAELVEKRRFLEQLSTTQKFVQRIGSRLTSATEIGEIFRIVCDAAKELFLYDGISMGFVEEDRLVVSYIDSEDMRDVQLPIYIPMSSREHISVHCVKSNRDLKVDSLEEYLALFNPPNAEEMRSHRMPYNESMMFIRMVHEDKVFGFITVQKREPGVYSDEEFEAIRAVGSFVSIAVNNVMKTAMLEEKVRQLEIIMLRDEVTWLENRRSYNSYMDELTAEDKEYMLLFADMNHLKQINDSLGHDVGDLYLTAFADILKTHVREYRKFRISGDEFVVILPCLCIEKAYELIEKIKAECAKIKIAEYPLSLAIGCGMRNRGENPDRVFTVAEARMYLDKHDYHKQHESMIYRLKADEGA